MANTDPKFVQVAIDVPVRTTFTYRIPAGLRESVSVGHRLYVPFRNRPRTGLATAIGDRRDPSLPPDVQLESVLEVLDPEPILPPAIVKLMDWVSRYYYAPPGEVLRLILPAPLRVRGKRLATLTDFGVQCLRSGLIEERLQRRALEALDGAGRPLPEDALRKRVPRLTLALLSELVQKGLIDIRAQRADRLRGRRLVPFVRQLGEAPPDARLGMKQRAVMNQLSGRDKVPLSEIRALTNASTTTIRALERRGLVTRFEEELYGDPFLGEAPLPVEPVERTSAQLRAIDQIVGDGRFDAFRSYVLHGITGSGKTEVYIGAIAAVIAAGKRALLLLPEIALTPQLVAVFRAHFGDAIAVLHSGLTPGQRFDEWRRIRRGEVKVVIGARSAIFAPIEQLGIIVVDEEHDGSFKQDAGVRYHARDLALVRGQLESAAVVLGSATPSLESLHRTEVGKSKLLVLAERPTGQPLPRVEIIDMRQVQKDASGRHPLLSPELQASLRRAVEAGQQAILFLNRRGHSPFVVCQACGTSCDCPHCEISLTYHRRTDRLRCHYCEFAKAMPDHCPVCQSENWAMLGAGTEKLNDQLTAELEGLRVVRLDRDTAAGSNVRQILRTFREHRADVLVGTQMVTKGHDFPKVTLVGVVMADLSLRIPDFRSGERTFQLLAQVAGRAGRGSEPGHVIIQTFMPEHVVIQAAARHDYAGFSGPELQTRLDLQYPPFGHLVALHFEGPDLVRLRHVTEQYRRAATTVQSGPGGDWSLLRVLGPVEAPLPRLRGRHRWQMLVRARSRQLLRGFVARLLQTVSSGLETEGVTVAVDVDPMHLL